MDLISIFNFIIWNQKKLTSKCWAIIYDWIQAICVQNILGTSKGWNVKLYIAKFHCIIDFTIIVPKLMTQSVTAIRVIKVFVELGMIDRLINE